MHPIRVYSVRPKLPKSLEPLWELAHNLWYSWNNSLEDLFVLIDQQLWRECQQNPVLFLNRLPQETLEKVAKDTFYLERLTEAKAYLHNYLSKPVTSIKFPQSDEHAPAVAYFSLEYGICLSLPIYSGGLGILAGDHLKSASDLNIPLVAIGLCYRQGYFRQYLTNDGWQQERYPTHDYDQMPLRLVKDATDAPLTIHLAAAGQTLHAQIWEAHVGRVSLYLLDTNLPENPPLFRELTAQLYGGDLEMRVLQEILLGIGGIKTLRALNLEPKVIHMNEGHSAFAGLERIRLFMAEHKLPFEAAMELVASTSIFTTHTPVPAGNDRFPPQLIQRYFEGYARDLGIAFKVLMALGRENPHDDNEEFCMTVLALKLSRFNNGVSKLHGHVSRKMWKQVWPQYPEQDVPIGAITNGVHVASWVAPDIALLYDRYLGNTWREDPDCERTWRLAETIAETELWRTHERLRARLVDHVRFRLHQQLESKGVRRKALEVANEVLDPQALTIGFARRFATYKRANLILQDKERLMRILNHARGPVQFIFAGKAHPQDNEGKKVLQDLFQLCREKECRHKMIFIEDYDIEIARYMVQGCDVWLNTPRRPLEACGTSGMKAMANGVLQLSSLDGWWAEAHKPDNSVGWAIGRGEEYDDPAYQDFVESQTLYNILENEIIPDFYDRGPGGIPRAWVGRMKKALKELLPVYSSHRMVEDYAENAYIPAIESFDRLKADSFSPAKDLAAWRMNIMTHWQDVRIRNVSAPLEKQLYADEEIPVRVEVFLAGLQPQDLQVDIYAGPVNIAGEFISRRTMQLTPSGPDKEGWQTYTGNIDPMQAGRFGFTIRVLPHHPLMLEPLSLGLVHWAPEEKE